MHFYPRVCDREQTGFWLERIFLRYERDGHAFFGVTLKETGNLIGMCGVLNQEVEGVVHAEIAYLFNRAYWHKGYASEAAQRCRDYGFEDLGVDHLISIIHDANTPSIGVATRNGMTMWKRAPFKELEAARIYRLDRADWERQREV